MYFYSKPVTTLFLWYIIVSTRPNDKRNISKRFDFFYHKIPHPIVLNRQPMLKMLDSNYDCNSIIIHHSTLKTLFQIVLRFLRKYLGNWIATFLFEVFHLRNIALVSMKLDDTFIVICE